MANVKKRTSENRPAILKDKMLLALIGSAAAALLVNLIFFHTYPINVGQSDNPTYLDMIIRGHSNLIHASGYSAIVYVLTHEIFPILPPVSIPNHTPSDIGASWFDTLQTVQLVIHLALFAISIFLCAKVFGKAVAAVAALGWGCNLLFISNADATAPEWLQGHALMLSILLHAYARNLPAGKEAAISKKKPAVSGRGARANKWKIAAYCLAAAIFGLAYLIKPNSLIFALALAPFLLFDTEGWGFRAIQAVASVSIFLAVTLSYANFYHFKSTGTTQLTFDRAWVLTAAMPGDYLSNPDRLGISSLRWAALLRVTPTDYFRAGGIEKIDYGPPLQQKQQAAAQYDSVFHASKDELIQFVKSHPLPKDYSQGSSAVPFYYYYGMERTDTLGTQVYLESVRAEPWFYAKKITESLWTFLREGLKGISTFPTLSDPMEYELLPPDFAFTSLGTTRYVPPFGSHPYFFQYYNPRETFSYGGMRLIGAIKKVTAAPVVYIVLNIIAVLGLFKLKTSLDRIAVFGIVAALGAFISASAVLLGLRQKELIALTPFYFLMVGISLVAAFTPLTIGRFGHAEGVQGR